MLKCKDLNISAGDKDLFKLDELSLDTGLYALVGRNGSGKSTFLNSLLGNHAVSSGEILFNGVLVSELTPKQLAKTVSLVKSKPFVFGDYTVYDLLLLGRLPHQDLFARESKSDRDKILEIAELMGIQSLLENSYATLSDGEKQLILVGRALIQDTPIILLDEPAAFLDMVNRIQLLELLKSISSKKLVLFSTHHIEELKVCDGVLLIENEQLSQLSNKESYLADIKEAFEL